MTLTFEQQEERAEVLAEVQRLKAEASRMVIRCNLIFDIKDYMWEWCYLQTTYENCSKAI